MCVCVCVSECEWDRKDIKTRFSAFTAEPLLAVPLPHVDVSAARLRESLPTDPTVMRLLTWGRAQTRNDTHIIQKKQQQKKRLMRIYYIQLQIKQMLRCAAVNSTHQNVRACVFGGWNTLQKIAHNHLLHTEKASLLEAATHHAHIHIHMVELHNTKDLKAAKLVIERDLNGPKHSGSRDCGFHFVVLEQRRPTLVERGTKKK